MVVSPFVALMKDQVRAMSERNMKAAYVGDAKEDAEIAQICGGNCGWTVDSHASF